eukprot:3148169-Pyramimonas_sp.AAC.1
MSAQPSQVSCPFREPPGAPPKASVAVTTCAPATNVGTPVTRFVAPLGHPPKAPAAVTTCVSGPHTPH